MSTFDVGVVGGGLGGLAVAATVAKTGSSVCVFERASAPGGRAVTHVEGGYRFNLGAHALYRGGAAERVLGALGAKIRGNPPPLAGALAVVGDADHGLPTGALSLALTGMLPARAKLEAARWLARLQTLGVEPLAGVSVRAWLEASVKDPALRTLLAALFRLTSFTNAPDLASAGSSVAQLAYSSRQGVVYVDGGWQTLVDPVLTVVWEAGAMVRTGAMVTAAEHGPGGWTIRGSDGPATSCRTLVLATSPGVARCIVRSEALDAWAASTVPAKVACLDVGLERLPRPETRLAIGIDRPLYYSVHSASATVAPDGCALVTTMKYLPAGEPPDAGRDLAELEAWLDHLQPGWQRRVVVRRHLPSMVASAAIARADQGGVGGRPGPRVPDAPDLFVVGDWVGHEGMLLDATLASADAAARAIVGPARARNVRDSRDVPLATVA
jgi:phytoene dehydrogenase-like protein